MPLAFNAGVKVSVPDGETAGPLENRSGMLLSTTNETVCPLSSGGPGLIAVAHPEIEWAPESSRKVWFAPFVNDGGSFTPVSVIVKVWVELVSMPPFAVPPLSWSSTLTVAEPFSLGTGV